MPKHARLPGFHGYSGVYADVRSVMMTSHISTGCTRWLVQVSAASATAQHWRQSLTTRTTSLYSRVRVCVHACRRDPTYLQPLAAIVRINYYIAVTGCPVAVAALSLLLLLLLSYPSSFTCSPPSLFSFDLLLGQTTHHAVAKILRIRKRRTQARMGFICQRLHR